MATRRAVKTAGKSRGWVVRILLVVLALFLFFKAVQLYGQIYEKQLALTDLDSRIETQVVINEGLADQNENADDYLEHKANEDGYYAPGQQVYQNEAG